VTLPANDPSIGDEDALLRRVPNRPMLLADDGRGGKRPSSAALELRDGETGCSVDVQSRLARPEDPGSVATGHPVGWGLACFSTAAARFEDRHRVVGDAQVDNEAHALVIPTASSRADQKRNFSRLARAMEWVRLPDVG
jgi:hypothetical protein